MTRAAGEQPASNVMPNVIQNSTHSATHSLSMRRVRWLARCAASTLLLALSACNAAPKLADHRADPFLGPERTAAVVSEAGAALQDASTSPIQAVTHTVAAAATSSKAALKTEPGAAEPRVAIHVTDTSAAEAQTRLASQYPDEYVFDGGDRALPIHYDEHGMLGLESEDTVVEFADDEGRAHVKPTNRVAVYAPRFAAISSVRGTSEEVSIGKLAGAYQAVRDISMDSRQQLVGHQQNVALSRIHTRTRGSEVDGQAQPNGVDQMVMVSGHAQALNVFEDLTFLRSGQFDKTEEARLSQAIQAAGIWSREQSPSIAATESEANEIYDWFNASEFVGLEDLRKKGELRIVKLADHQVARSGDVITFTIRYDNTGDRELRDIVITDNLSPRLEYVPDSATSDRAGQLVENISNDGTLILRWELSEPLPGHTGGTVTFQAKVR